MARVPVWADVCRTDLGTFAERAACLPKSACSCPTATTQVVASAGSAVAKQAAGEVAKSTLKNVGPIAVAFVAIESLHAGVQYSQGKISRGEAIERSVCSAAGGAGGVGGATVGAIIGTAICPGVGTALGGFIGSVLGGLGARWGASKAMA